MWSQNNSKEKEHRHCKEYNGVTKATKSVYKANNRHQRSIQVQRVLICFLSHLIFIYIIHIMDLDSPFQVSVSLYFKVFLKNKLATGNTPFFVIGSFRTHHSICLNIGFYMAVLYPNNVFSNLVPSTRKR